jgi:hypothetical protein
VQLAFAIPRGPVYAAGLRFLTTLKTSSRFESLP